MAKRWTIEELNKTSNKNLLLSIISERQSGLHPYAPLAERLRKLRRWVERNVRARD